MWIKIKITYVRYEWKSTIIVYNTLNMCCKFKAKQRVTQRFYLEKNNVLEEYWKCSFNQRKCNIWIIKLFLSYFDVGGDVLFSSESFHFYQWNIMSFKLFHATAVTVSGKGKKKERYMKDQIIFHWWHLIVFETHLYFMK